MAFCTCALVVHSRRRARSAAPRCVALGHSRCGISWSPARNNAVTHAHPGCRHTQRHYLVDQRASVPNDTLPGRLRAVAAFHTLDMAISNGDVEPLCNVREHA
eukprot:3200530-Rhodomonas_salina.1